MKPKKFRDCTLNKHLLGLIRMLNLLNDDDVSFMSPLIQGFVHHTINIHIKVPSYMVAKHSVHGFRDVIGDHPNLVVTRIEIHGNQHIKT